MVNLTGTRSWIQLAPTTTPGRVYKGSRRPGHMGNDRVTAQNLKVILVDPERNLLASMDLYPDRAVVW